MPGLMDLFNPLGSAGSLAGTALSGDGGMPGAMTMPVDARTREELGNQRDRAFMTTAGPGSKGYGETGYNSTYDETLNGTDQARGLLNNEDAQRKASALGGNQDTGTQQAISNRANKAFESDYNKLQRNQVFQSQARLVDRQNAAIDASLKEHQALLGNASRELDAKQNQQAARSAALGSLMGAAGSFAGMAAGSRGRGGAPSSGLQGNQMNYADASPGESDLGSNSGNYA